MIEFLITLIHSPANALYRPGGYENIILRMESYVSGVT